MHLTLLYFDATLLENNDSDEYLLNVQRDIIDNFMFVVERGLKQKLAV